MALGRIEGPLDYRSLWVRLYNILSEEMAADVAVRAVTEKDPTRVPRHQGAFAFIEEVKAKMDELLAISQAANGAVRFTTEDEV